jgi:hypothetical protein
MQRSWGWVGAAGPLIKQGIVSIYPQVLDSETWSDLEAIRKFAGE